MKVSNSSSPVPLALKIVGGILIVSSLIDYLVQVIPFNVANRDWQISNVPAMVDRGLTPLVGVALLLVAYWIGNSGNGHRRAIWQDLRLWAFVFATLMGILFLALVPIHLNNINYARDQALKQINEKATQAETQVTTQKQQVDTLLKNPQNITQLQQEINSGKYQGQQLAQLQALRENLQKFQQNPKALSEESEKALSEIRSRKSQVEESAQREAVTSVVRTGVKSLLLALAYTAIGWTGFRSLGGTRSPMPPR